MKKAKGGTGANQHKQKGQNDPSAKTAEKLASEHGVSGPTVKRAGKLAEAASKLGIEGELTSGELKASQKEILKAAKSLPKNPKPEDVLTAALRPLNAEGDIPCLPNAKGLHGAT